MADISADSILPSGVFKPESYVIGSIAPGVTGAILPTITAPAGKKIKVIGLTSSAPQSGITVNMDGAAVISTLSLEPRASTTGFCIGNMSSPGGVGGLGSAGDGVNVIPYLLGYSSFSISKNAGDTIATIYYSYLIGV